MRYLSALSLFVAGLAVTVPFLWPYHAFPMLTFHAEWIAFLLGMIAAALVLGQRAPAPPLPWLALALMGFCGVLYLQMLLGRVAYPERSVVGMLYTLWAALMIWTGAALRARLGAGKACLALQGFLAAGGLLMAASGFMEEFHLRTVVGELMEKGGLTGMNGVIGQRNLFANYVACGLISTVFLHAGRRIGLAAAILLAVPMGMALGYSESRSAWVYVGILVAALVWLSFVERQAAGWRAWLPCAAAAAAFALARLVLAGDIPPKYEGTAGLLWFAGLEHGGEPLAPRTLLAWHAWNMFKTHPVLGVGFGEFAWNVFRNATLVGANAAPGLDRNAHNIVLHLLAETGLAGFAVVAIGATAWVREFVRTPVSPERIWIAAVLAVQGAHSLVEFPLWFAQFLGLTALLAGVAEERGARFGVSRLGRYGTIALLVAGFAGTAVVYRDYRSFEAWFDEAVREAHSANSRSREELNKLVRLHETSMFSPFYELMIAETMPLDSNSLEAKLAFNEQVMHVLPLPTAACRQAVLLALAGRQDEAWADWRRLQIVFPEYEGLFRVGLERAAANSDALRPLARQANAGHSAQNPSGTAKGPPTGGNDFCWIPLSER